MSFPFKNAFYLTLANALQALSGILVILLLARPLGTEEFGRLLLEWNTIILHQFSGNLGVGLYQAAFRFMLATMVISDVLLQTFFPVIARLATTNVPRFIKTCTLLNRYLLATGDIPPEIEP